MRAFQAGNLSGVDRRLAVTASLPTPTPPEEKFNMLIAYKSAVATFPLQVILDSLATTHQPATWTTAKSVCRDFMRVKNVGISFNCTDRDMVTRLGGLKLMICGRPFPIREYSEYSHLYWIDLTLASDTQPDDIWTYFDARGEPPVMIKSTFDKNSIQSRHITVYFETRDPPKCLMFAPNDPVRELFVHGPESPPTFVHHRITRYNKTVPPSLRATRQLSRQGNNQASQPAKAMNNNFNTNATVAFQPPTSTADTPMDSSAPSSDSEADQDDPISENDDMGRFSSSDDSDTPLRPAQATQLDDTTSQVSAEDFTVQVHPHIIHAAHDRLIQTHTAIPEDSPIWYRAQLSRDTTSHHGIVAHSFPSTYNWFEVLQDAEYDLDPSPAPYNMKIAGNANLYAAYCRSHADLHAYSTINTDVESMTIGELTDYLEHYANCYHAEEDPSAALAMIQASPGHLAPLLDVRTPKNMSVLHAKLPGHALQRYIQTNDFYFPLIKTAKNKAPGPDGLPVEYYLTLQTLTTGHVFLKFATPTSLTKNA
ncbi:hypothetical protein H310_14624 [Aphanomyces invadans]|uniref:Uncharacterized protein n=1 Tax=Aphanomyces invadans TaxID=157072 RepID=A0A024TAH2_9STRA|nr:hypothetical protein H310_14624 [Aphanomyces invadans]ETV90621.1 hypothetical protein H310_14624 [Aphanomyces invadans]|eukprot:XP_008880742.1 hypothetical protein H310_14624 [Aphanomyces invadans]